MKITDPLGQGLCIAKALGFRRGLSFYLGVDIRDPQLAEDTSFL